MNKHSVEFRKRRRDTTAELLIQAAEAVIARRGYEDVTMNDVAAEAGCAAGTLYLYFKNKQELVMALVERHGRRFRQLVADAMAATPDPLDKLRRATQTFLEYFSRNRNYFKVLYSSNLFRRGVLPGSLPKGEQEERKRYQAAILEVIRQAQAKGKIRRDFPPEAVAGFMRGYMLGMMDQYSALETLPPLEEQMRVLWAFMMGGLSAPAG